LSNRSRLNQKEMGCYLPKPNTETDLEDQDGCGLRTAAGAMQGWRVTQEDAHNVILELMKDISLFAVYDGHGGHEVAEWTGEHLPKTIIEKFKEINTDDVEQVKDTLSSIFHAHDKRITEREIVKVLHKIANKDCPMTRNEEEIQEEVDGLAMDMEMTREQLIEKFGARQPILMPGEEDDDEQQGSSSENAELKKQAVALALKMWEEACENESSDDDDESGDEKDQTEKDEEEKENKTEKEENQLDAEIRSEFKKIEKEERSKKRIAEEEAGANDEYDYVPPARKSRTALSAEERQNRLAESNNENGEGGVVNEEHSEASSSESENSDYEDIPELESKNANQEVCGQDSGCTAVVTLLNHKTKKIITANIGDSRGVLSRAGKAVELSFDHKPEDDIELTRIKKAGGYLTPDGRVKGGLNLSRAFGDHQYKQYRKLPLFEQMVTAKPDFTVHDLTDEDEFMIIACDGIWNSMTSQEAVNYVRDRLRKDEKISEIIKELFDLILAPDTDGDGTGCDNMTCVIVAFKNATFVSYNIRSPKRDEDGNAVLTQTENAIY